MISRSETVIVGAGLAGLRFAEEARRQGIEAPIAIYGNEPHMPYSRPPLSKTALSQSADLADLTFPLKPSMAGVRWHLSTAIVSADLAARTITTENGELVPYETLVIATGLRPRLEILGAVDAHRVHQLRTFLDARRLRKALGQGQHITVLGGGFVGTEVAATARQLGTGVTLVCADTLPLRRQLHEGLANRLLSEHVRHGVQVVASTKVARLSGGSREPIEVELESGQSFRTDAVVQAVGSAYNVEWLAGNDLDLSRGVLTDSAMQPLTVSGKPVENCFAIGDVARFPNELFDSVPRTLGHWNVSKETARRAAQALAYAGRASAGSDSTMPFAFVPSFWSDQYELQLLSYGMTGLATESILAAGTLDGDCIVEYRRGEQLVAVCGIGMRSKLMAYRGRIGSRTR